MSRILGRKVLFQFAIIRCFHFTKERQHILKDEYDLIKKVNNLLSLTFYLKRRTNG